MIGREDEEIARFRTSPLLTQAGFRHAFFTRRGGASTGPYSSLSFSVAAGDSEEHVARNVERAAQVLGVSADRVYYLSQVHGTAAIDVRGDEDRLEVLHREADAILGRNPDAALGVRMADCLPILVGDPTTGAAAAIHAGWRGLVRGVIGAGMDALRRQGASGELLAAIGPHIGGAAFEVSHDVADELSRCSDARDAVDTRYGEKPHVHLVRVARAQLEAAGARVDVVDGCTYTDASEFFSFRRDGKRSGRHLAAIVPR
jgi:purine-nucleoside/S-methyl-5'-thioadenosine phosphorylase / adenosine deaminase